MTTLDGATTLDSTYFILPASTAICVQLQSTLDLSQQTVNEIVDIRCSNSTPAGCLAISASLIAISVDALSGPAARPS